MVIPNNSCLPQPQQHRWGLPLDWQWWNKRCWSACTLWSPGRWRSRWPWAGSCQHHTRLLWLSSSSPFFLCAHFCLQQTPLHVLTSHTFWSTTHIYIWLTEPFIHSLVGGSKEWVSKWIMAYRHKVKTNCLITKSWPQHYTKNGHVIFLIICYCKPCCQ